MSADQLVGLISACRSLTELNLNCEPHWDRDPSFDLHVLATLAEICPNLERLSFFLNAGRDGGYPPANVVFRKLRSLSLGHSRIEDVESTADYLSQLLSPGCALLSSRRTELELVESMLDAGVAFSERKAKWTEVQKLLPLLINAREDEREKNRALREEIEYFELAQRDVAQVVEADNAKVSELMAENASLRQRLRILEDGSSLLSQQAPNKN